MRLPYVARPRPLSLQVLATLIFGLATCQSQRSKTFDVVKDFGAVGDGVVKDTAAIQRAVAAVAAAGSGTILFPSGHRFLTGPFNLTSHCTIFIDANATLLGSMEKADWPIIAALPSYGQGKKGICEPRVP